MGYVDDEESVSSRVLGADVKNVPCSARKMNLGRTVVAADGGGSCAPKDEDQLREGAVRRVPVVAVEGRGRARGDG